jgi:high-affinity Fe2+/Pb2+ permease
MSGLWGGPDPLVRWLRLISVVAFLVLIVVLVLDPTRSGDLPLQALLVGAILLQLGYEVAVPGLQRSDRKEPPHERRDDR